MPQMNDFDATVHSLGECIVSYIGRDHLKSVTIWADELSGTADIAIVLDQETWAEQERAIDVMVEIREMFLDDIALDYRFDTEESLSSRGSTKAATVQLV